MQEVIEQSSELVVKYKTKLSAIPDDAFMAKPAQGKWSKKEIIGHLVDSAQNNIQRFVRAQYINRPHIVYHQDEWVTEQNYQQYNRQDLIELWAMLNRHICIILANMPVEMYSREVNIGKEEEKLVTVQFLAEDYITHHLHHIKQIFTH